MSVHFIKCEQLAVSDAFDEIGVLWFGIWQFCDYRHYFRYRPAVELAFESFEYFSVRPFYVRDFVAAFITFPFEHYLASVGIGICYLSPCAHRVGVLLRGVHFNFYR